MLDLALARLEERSTGLRLRPSIERESMHPAPTSAHVHERVLRRPIDSTAASPPSQISPLVDTGRNDPFPCGTGLKFKRCHGGA